MARFLQFITFIYEVLGSEKSTPVAKPRRERKKKESRKLSGRKLTYGGDTETEDEPSEVDTREEHEDEKEDDERADNGSPEEDDEIEDDEEKTPSPLLRKRGKGRRGINPLKLSATYSRKRKSPIVNESPAPSGSLGVTDEVDESVPQSVEKPSQTPSDRLQSTQEDVIGTEEVNPTPDSAIEEQLPKRSKRTKYSQFR